jgi:hypothetical protein
MIVMIIVADPDEVWRNLRKSSVLNNFYFSPYLFDNIFFSIGHISFLVGSVSDRIHKSGLRLRGSGFERNIYGSATLFMTMMNLIPC